MLDSPIAVIALVLVLVIVVSVLIGRREPKGLRGGKAAYRGGTARRARRIAAVLMVGAVALLAIGLTQFRFLQEAGSAGTVILALDVSESMGRTDVEPSRLEAAKEAARVFLDRLPSELQVGLVAFAAEADVVVRPTANRRDVVSSLEELPRGEGTAVGGGLDASLGLVEAELEEQGDDAAAAVVLLSDGRDCELAASQCPPSGVATVPSADASARADALGVQVHTVLLGPAATSAEGAESAALLERIAETTGGSAYTADTASGLIEVYETLESEISTELAITDFGALFVGVAGALAVAATIAILIALRSEY
ncbi:MAG: vWA domain-containing protein [Actinomycetota bacterium]